MIRFYLRETDLEKSGGQHDNEGFCGTTVVGERGQVVIPADIRHALDIQPGMRLLVWRHPSGKGLMMFPLDEVRQFMDLLLVSLEKAEKSEEEDKS